MRDPDAVARRADELRDKYPDAMTPYWWYIVRPVCKIVCLTLIGAPPLAVSVGLEVSPLGLFIMGLLALAGGYGLSEMSPGFRPKGDDRG